MPPHKAGQLLSMLAAVLIFGREHPDVGVVLGRHRTPSSGTSTTTANAVSSARGSDGSWAEKAVANAGSRNAVSCPVDEHLRRCRH